MLGSGPQLCQIVPEGLPETEPDLCSGSIPDSATLVQLHVQEQGPMRCSHDHEKGGNASECEQRQSLDDVRTGAK